MSPHQCPECGRFLKNDLVETLGAEPTPCPRCETGLVASMFAVEPAAAVAGAEPAEDPPASVEETVGDSEPSVRPPDLPPTDVREHSTDVLAGWDRDTGPPPVVDRAPFPVDAVVLVGGGLVGALVGVLVCERGGRGGVLGAAAGVLGAAAARRVWRLA